MSISLELRSDLPEVAEVEMRLREFNLGVVQSDRCFPLNLFARIPTGEIVGGLLGETYWDWLHVRILWVRESHRRAGLGSRMLEQAEREAQRRACLNAHLDTHDFQAEEFYLKRGYEVFGVLEDLPHGHRRIYMRKKLPG